MMRVANKTMVTDPALDQAVFLENCKADVLKTAGIDAGAPLGGANNYTETQSKDRVVANGIGMPAAMTKYENVIWRGTAIKDGKSVNVAVDYKGNLVKQ
jgi:hypothetical protein